MMSEDNLGHGSILKCCKVREILFVFEAEFSSKEATAFFAPSAFVGEEVTFNPAYSGFALARKEP